MGRVLARGGAAGQTGAGGPSNFHLPRALAGFSLAADYDGFGFYDGAAGGIGQAVGPVRQRLRADLCGIGADARADDRGFRLFSAVVYQRDSARGGEGVTDEEPRVEMGNSLAEIDAVSDRRCVAVAQTSKWSTAAATQQLDSFV